MAEVEEKLFRYAVTSDGFNMWLCGEHVTTKDKVFTVNADQNRELQSLIKKGRHDISSQLTYIDVAAAEAIAKEFIKNARPAAHQGAAGSDVGKMGIDKGTTGDATEVKPVEPAGMTLKERIAANRDNVLATQNVVEEDVVHVEDGSK